MHPELGDQQPPAWGGAFGLPCQLKQGGGKPRTGQLPGSRCVLRGALGDPVRQQGQEHVGLAVEPGVDHPLEEARLIGDLLQRHGVIPAGHEHRKAAASSSARLRSFCSARDRRGLIPLIFKYHRYQHQMRAPAQAERSPRHTTSPPPPHPRRQARCACQVRPTWRRRHPSPPAPKPPARYHAGLPLLQPAPDWPDLCPLRDTKVAAYAGRVDRDLSPSQDSGHTEPPPCSPCVAGAHDPADDPLEFLAQLGDWPRAQPAISPPGSSSPWARRKACTRGRPP